MRDTAPITLTFDFTRSELIAILACWCVDTDYPSLDPLSAKGVCVALQSQLASGGFRYNWVNQVRAVDADARIHRITDIANWADAQVTRVWPALKSVVD